MRRLFVAGNSHVAALKRAVPPAGLDVTVLPLGRGRFETQTFSSREATGVALLPEEYGRNLRRHAGRDTIAADPAETWGILAVNHNARVYRDRTWQTHEPAAVAVPGTAPVTAGLVRSIVERDHQGVRTFLRHLQEAGVDVFAVSAPWPRRDHPAIGRVVRPEVVLHLDALARSVWADWLAGRGIDLVEPPARTADDDGFLRPEYASDRTQKGTRDQHHANPAYGELMLEEIARHHG